MRKRTVYAKKKVAPWNKYKKKTMLKNNFEPVHAVLKMNFNNNEVS